MKAKVKFAKVRPEAIIPSKRKEDMGFDIYSCFDEDYIMIGAHETVLVPTGIASSCDPEYGFLVFERGSTGSKGIARRCGVIDSGYRGEWFIGLTNTTNRMLFITKLTEEETKKDFVEKCVESIDVVGMGLSKDDVRKDAEYAADWSIVYPYSKAIAQALVVPVPEVEEETLTYDELKEIDSERGAGALGSSSK